MDYTAYLQMHLTALDERDETSHLTNEGRPCKARRSDITSDASEFQKRKRDLETVSVLKFAA